MHRAPQVTEPHALSGNLIVCDAESEIDASALGPCSARPTCEAVPDRCNDLFEQANEHSSIVHRGLTESVTSVRTHKNPGGRPLVDPRWDGSEAELGTGRKGRLAGFR